MIKSNIYNLYSSWIDGIIFPRGGQKRSTDVFFKDYLIILNKEFFMGSTDLVGPVT